MEPDLFVMTEQDSGVCQCVLTRAEGGDAQPSRGSHQMRNTTSSCPNVLQSSEGL